jgi:hypothetical protein
MSFKHFQKDPDGLLDFTVDWSEWLGTDTISTSTWVVASGITRNADSRTTTAATIWLSGGTVDTDYVVTNRITTAAGRTEDRTLVIEVRQR